MRELIRNPAPGSRSACSPTTAAARRAFPRRNGRRINAVRNDSRKTGNGDVFVALETERRRAQVCEKRARPGRDCRACFEKEGVVVFHEEQARLIAVSDPLSALQRAASRYRATLKCKIVGITGSSGKTTARAFISTVLRQSHTVAETQGNCNNHIGVPLSLLGFTGKETAGVIEMGANHAGKYTSFRKSCGPTSA